ncbi:hypothetical protein E5288_WYG013996 [Bos mutus]|uniref:C2H2-type domain-containing protein n=1 Tax=Bos mutus TaxID=72004 RepID=A0A6B0RLL2_9CETA|nr:hypothetical protein [Bos mutus]
MFKGTGSLEHWTALSSGMEPETALWGPDLQDPGQSPDDGHPGAESGNEEESTQQESSGEEVILGDPDQSPEFKDPSEMPLETPSQDASGPQDAPAPLGHANPSDHQTPLDTPSPESYICSHCGESFLDRSVLLQHQVTHGNEKPYLFPDYRIGLGEGAGPSPFLSGKPFKCPECKKSFALSSELLLHQKVHAGGKAQKSPELGKSSSVLLEHLRSPLGARPYSCSDCGASFLDRLALIRHQETHTREKSPIPEDPLPEPATLSTSQEGEGEAPVPTESSSHEEGGSPKTSLEEKPYLCPECGDGFTEVSALLLHRSCHPGVTL